MPDARRQGRALLLSPGAWNAWWLAGLALLPLQFVQLSIVQSGQLWALALFGMLAWRHLLRGTPREAYFYLVFMAVALVETVFSGYPRIKAAEQIIKFGLIYPAFFLVGRAAGEEYLQRKLPYGYIALWLLLAFEFAAQRFNLPVIYVAVDFMQGALHGTFKERNWLAVYFFLASYCLFLQSPRKVRDATAFVAINVAVALLSESKTILIPCGMVLMLQFPGRIFLKSIALTAGTFLFIWRFGYELSGHLLQVRLEEERGLAFMQSVPLLRENLWGYGFGFVEAHFSSLWITIKGLGAGTNSVFSSPLDFLIIGGFAGLLFWCVFFLGVGVRSILLLAPIAAWSLLNPLHQSEIVYLFLGFLVSRGMSGTKREPIASEVHR